MAGESVEELLRSLTGAAGESAPEIYGAWASITPGDSTLEQLVRRKLINNAKTTQLRESLTATLQAGGAVGESPAECLLKSGLVGWS